MGGIGGRPELLRRASASASGSSTPCPCKALVCSRMPGIRTGSRWRSAGGCRSMAAGLSPGAAWDGHVREGEQVASAGAAGRGGQLIPGRPGGEDPLLGVSWAWSSVGPGWEASPTRTPQYPHRCKTHQGTGRTWGQRSWSRAFNSSTVLWSCSMSVWACLYSWQPRRSSPRWERYFYSYSGSGCDGGHLKDPRAWIGGC